MLGRHTLPDTKRSFNPDGPSAPLNKVKQSSCVSDSDSVLHFYETQRARISEDRAEARTTKHLTPAGHRTENNQLANKRVPCGPSTKAQWLDPRNDPALFVGRGGVPPEPDDLYRSWLRAPTPSRALRWRA